MREKSGMARTGASGQQPGQRAWVTLSTPSTPKCPVPHLNGYSLIHVKMRCKKYVQVSQNNCCMPSDEVMGRDRDKMSNFKVNLKQEQSHHRPVVLDMSTCQCVNYMAGTHQGLWSSRYKAGRWISNKLPGGNACPKTTHEEPLSQAREDWVCEDTSSMWQSQACKVTCIVLCGTEDTYISCGPEVFNHSFNPFHHLSSHGCFFRTRGHEVIKVNYFLMQSSG
jgi:hypothetical protein